MVVSNDNKGSPKNQGVKSPSTETSFRARIAPLPRTFEGEEYYGAADVAKIIGVRLSVFSRRHSSECRLFLCPINCQTPSLMLQYFRPRIESSQGWRLNISLLNPLKGGTISYGCFT